LEEREVEEGQFPDRSLESVQGNGRLTQSREGGLWNETDESYYNRDDTSGSRSSGRWHYPANFEDADAVPIPSLKKKKKKEKKDRWARTEDAHMGVSLDNSTSRRKKKKKSNVDVNTDLINPSRPSLDSSTVEGPEDPEGMQYGKSSHQIANGAASTQTPDEFNHEF
jgi:hypothetical protein